MSGRSLVPSMDRKRRPQRCGQNSHAICLCMAKLRNWSPLWLPCPPLRLRLGRAAVCPRKLSTTLLPMPSACGILLFGRKGCMSAVASLKPLVKALWLLVSSALACVGPLMAWMLFCLYGLPFSTRPTTISGKANCVSLLNHPQRIHTPFVRESLDKQINLCYLLYESASTFQRFHISALPHFSAFILTRCGSVSTVSHKSGTWSYSHESLVGRKNP